MPAFGPGGGGGEGGTSLQEANGDVSLDGAGIFTTGLTILRLHFQ